jgi:hypothetical protein
VCGSPPTLYLHVEAVSHLHKSLAFGLIVSAAAPGFANPNYVVRAAEVRFQADATALPAGERERLHEFVLSLRVALWPGMKCPRLSAVAWASGLGSAQRSTPKQKQLSMARLAYVKRVLAGLGAEDEDIYYGFAPPKMLDPVGANSVVLEATLGAADRYDQGHCAEWLRR